MESLEAPGRRWWWGRELHGVAGRLQRDLCDQWRRREL